MKTRIQLLSLADFTDLAIEYQANPVNGIFHRTVFVITTYSPELLKQLTDDETLGASPQLQVYFETAHYAYFWNSHVIKIHPVTVSRFWGSEDIPNKSHSTPEKKQEFEAARAKFSDLRKGALDLLLANFEPALAHLETLGDHKIRVMPVFAVENPQVDAYVAGALGSPLEVTLNR